MANSLKVRMNAEELRVRTAGAILPTYTIMTNLTATLNLFEHPIKVLFIENLSSGSIIFSFDGITDHLILPTMGHFSFDISTNKSNPGDDLEIETRKGVWVRQAVGAVTGSVYVSAFYSY